MTERSDIDPYRRTDWRVRTYDEDDNIIDTWIIEDRTESEAENEAMVDVRDAADWSMVESRKET